MKRNKLAKKLTAALLTGAMVMSMGGMTAFADTPKEIENITLTKTVTTDGKTFAPNTEFKFTISEGKGGNMQIDGKNQSVEPGRPGLFTISSSVPSGQERNDLKFAPDTTQDPKGSYNRELIYDVNDPSEVGISKPGIYHYTIMETNDGYEGITYDDKERNIFVYVNSKVDENNTPTGELYVSAIICEKDGGYEGLDQGSSKTGLTFTNDYGETNDKVHSLKVTKHIRGNQASAGDKFTFEVTVAGTSGEAYWVIYNEGLDTEEKQSVVSGQTVTFKNVQADGIIMIYGLTSGDTYTVEETDNAGYTKTFVKEVGSETEKEAGNISGTIETNSAAEFINEKKADTPTGIAMTFAPYAVMVAFAGVFAVMFLRKKREDF